MANSQQQPQKKQDNGIYYLSIPVEELASFMTTLPEPRALQDLNLAIIECLHAHSNLTTTPIFSNLTATILHHNLLDSSFMAAKGNLDNIALYSDTDSVIISHFPDETEPTPQYGEFEDNSVDDDTDLGLENPDEEAFVTALRRGRELQLRHSSEIVRYYALWLHIKIMPNNIEEPLHSHLKKLSAKLQCPLSKCFIEYFRHCDNINYLKELQNKYQNDIPASTVNNKCNL